jgi:hypothetical protein
MDSSGLDRVQWQVLVNMTISHQIPQKADKTIWVLAAEGLWSIKLPDVTFNLSFINYLNISFSRTMLHEVTWCDFQLHVEVYLKN